MEAKIELSFEEAMGQLDQTVKKLESGQLSLEESLELFAIGIELVKLCHGRLEVAEKKVEELIQSADGAISFKQFNLGEEQI